MKAWALQSFGLDNLTMVDLPKPEPQKSEVLIRVAAVSLNYRDRMLVEGLYNPALQFPRIQVADTAGEIVQVGPEVSRFKTGDRVLTNYATKWIDGPAIGDESTYTLGNTIHGGLAEYLVLDEQALVATPEYLSDDEASTLPVAALTAWNALRKGGLKEGQTVLVQGTGGVSIFGLQIATALGAKVIVTSSSGEKLKRAEALGAYATINYIETPEWNKEALKLTSQLGVDHILEVAAGKSLGQSLDAIKPSGNIALIGLLEGFTSEIPIFAALSKQATIRGIITGSRKDFEEMVAQLSEIKVRPVIDAVYSFNDARSAYDHLYRGAFGKIVIHVQGNLN